MNPMQKNNKQS